MAADYLPFSTALRIVGLIILLLSNLTQGAAQSGKVLLDNGSVLYGEVAELNLEKLSIQVGSDRIDLAIDNISLIKIKKRSDSIQNIDMALYRRLSKNSFRGVEKNIQLGVLHGRRDEDVAAKSLFSMSLQLNYRYSQFLQGGIAVGYDHFNEFGTFPVQLVYRGDLSSKWSTLFYYVSAGYGFTKLLETDDALAGIDRARGGMTYRAGLGYGWRMEKVGFELTAGWKRQSVEMVYEFGDLIGLPTENATTLKRLINRAEIKFGVIF